MPFYQLFVFFTCFCRLAEYCRLSRTCCSDSVPLLGMWTLDIHAHITTDPTEHSTCRQTAVHCDMGETCAGQYIVVVALSGRVMI